MVVVLPAPLGPRESEDVAGLHVERQSLNSDGIAIGFVKIDDVDHGCSCILKLYRKVGDQ